MSYQPPRPPSLVMRRGPRPNQTFPLHKTVLTLGRAADNDIVIDDGGVSRHHARLSRQEGNWVLEDLGSRNGTFVNGQRITGLMNLTPGDEVALGPDVLFSVEGGAPAEALPEPEKPAPPPAAVTAPPKPKGGLPGWVFAVIGVLVLICIVVAVVAVASLMWLSGRPNEEIIETIPTLTPIVVVVTAPPTNTPPSVVEPTPTLQPVESELAQFEDTSGLFELRYPATLSQVEPSTEQGDYGYTFSNAADTEIILVSFRILADDPLSDDEWSAFADNFASELVTLFTDTFGADSVELDRQVGGRGSHTLLQVVKSEAAGTRGVMYVEEAGGVMAMLVWVIEDTVWPQRQTMTHDVLKSFIWSSPAARAVLGEAVTAKPTDTSLVGILSPPTSVPVAPLLPSSTIITPDNARQLVEVSQTQTGGEPGELAWSPDGRWLALPEARQLRLYEAGTLTPVSLPHEIETGVLAFSPDGTYLATTRYEESGQILVEVWQVANWTLARTLVGHPNSILDLAFSPDGSLLASAAMDARVRLWRTSSGELVHELKVSYMGVHPPGVLSVAFSPDGTQVVAGVYGGSVQGWQVDNGAQTVNFQAASLPQPNEVIALPNGLLVTVEGYGADLWQLDGTHLAELQSDSSAIHGAVSPDGRVLAVAHHDGVELWDIDNHTLVHRLSGMKKIAFSPDGVYLVTVGDDKTLRLWGVGK